MRLSVLAEVVVMAEGETVPHEVEARVLRSLRRFFRGQMGFRYRGGLVVDWNGHLASRAAALVGPLRSFYTSSLESCEPSGRAA